MVEMTPAEVTTILRQFNGWRRDFDDKFEQPDPHEVSEAIDAAVEMIERLEAAEKSDAESLAMYRKARDERDALRAKIEAAEKERDNANAASVNIALEAERLQCENDALRAVLRHEADCVEAAKAEIEALRAKIAEMEEQGPVAWLHETRRDSDVVTDAVKHVWGKVAVGAMAAYSIPLGILPDAQGEEK